MPRPRTGDTGSISSHVSMEEQDRKEVGPASCRHYWMIQPTQGPLSPGVCQVCGEAREFKNYVEGGS